MTDFTEALMNAIAESEFELDCPTCGKEFTVSVSDVGSDVTCPHCGKIITLEAE